MKKIIIDGEKIKELYLAHCSVAEIANLLGNCSRATVSRELKRLNVKLRTSWESKTIQLTSEQQIRIKELFIQHNAINPVAKILQMDRTVITNFLVKEGLFKKRIKKIKFTEKQYQLLLGSLLGDGCITKHFSYIESHCDAQKEYIEFKSNILDSPMYSRITKFGFNPGKMVHTTTFANKKLLKPLKELCYSTGIKTITKEWVDLLTPEAICWWFLDDGSTSLTKGAYIKVEFSTDCFSEPECMLLQQCLGKFNIQTSIQKHKVKNNIFHKINVLQTSVNDFMDLIEPYVSKIPCMMYKIKRRTTPVNNRGQTSWKKA